MLAKKFRLQIQSVLNKSGRNLRSRCFLFKIFSGASDYNLFGVVISKKVNKSSAERNRLKRIILDSAKKFVQTENNKKYSVLIIVSPTVAKLEKTDIIKELDESLSKIVNS
jgi:ribonuclease P protein component